MVMNRLLHIKKKRQDRLKGQKDRRERRENAGCIWEKGVVEKAIECARGEADSGTKW